MASLPSPASSPALDPADAVVQPSRKRQRSRSMQSDTSSSSVKRPVSDGTPLDPAVRSPSSDQMSSLTLADSAQEIDSYMAEQGEETIPLFLSAVPPQEDSSLQNMAPTDKVAFVEKGKAGKMEAGETWHLVSKRWFKRWSSACTGEAGKDEVVSEQDLGPVDNSPLLDDAGDLKKGLIEGIDVEYVPEDVWAALTTWYGQPQHPLPRRVTTRGVYAKTSSLELYPPKIKVFRLATDAPTNLSLGPPHPTVPVSIGDSVKSLCAKVAEAVKVDDSSNVPYRVWKLTNIDDWRTVEFPTEKLENLGADIVEESEISLEDHGIEDGDAYIVEFKSSDGWLVESDSSKKTFAIEGPPPLFDSKDSFFNRMGSSSSKSATTATSTATATTKTTTDFFSGFSSKSITSNKSYNKTLVPGTLGLGNMGNTCFMNSALQCLAHTEELAEYFLSGVFKTELNFDNPLGMRGAIAEVFGSLLERIWASSGPSNSYSPREFKQTLQRFAPQFSGYQQHDTQEFVAFLLDGLHEDLNRVLKKPYVEKPDWEGGGDVELAKLARDSWEGYMLRNDSVIVDLFQGQYQSTLVCPDCQKVSITFDPFMYLTLPLPVEKKWSHTIYYIPWDQAKPHVEVPVEINRDATFKELRALLGRWMDAPPENLCTMEIFNHRFYKPLDDKVAVADMGTADTIVCYELPCNARQGWGYKKKDDDPWILPLFLADQKPPIKTSMYGSTRTQVSYFGYPTIVVISKEDASSVDAIYHNVVSRLERWTAHAPDLYQWEHSLDAEDAITKISAHSTFTPPLESVTEITPEGDVREVEQPVVDLTEEKGMDVDPPAEEPATTPRPVRAKKDLFDLRLQANHKDTGNLYSSYSQSKWLTWEDRKVDAENHSLSSLLKETDGLYCEFDENMKAYFFGEHANSFEHAKWRVWKEFVHAEYSEGKKASAQKQKKGLTLEDCLEEFVREEQLGEDDLWYCPKCKKHQQATKKFDLWKAPDILVVHLKRFSNSRILRDKIDSLVDFPIEGLDLGDKIGERAVAKRLKEQGIEIEEFKSLELEEPLLYDLFAVDEHIGGLGGGHYRAYSVNHQNGKWYHFDDGYVTEAKATSAINPNAYLLFYRRRSTTPLGGRTHETVQKHKDEAPEPQPGAAEETQGDPPRSADGQLPTPPSENEERVDGKFDPRMNSLIKRLGYDPHNPMSIPGVADMMTLAPHLSDDAPAYEDLHNESLVSDSYDTVFPTAHSYGFSDHSHFRKPSPTSSNEAEVDQDFDSAAENMWDPTYSSTYSFKIGLDEDGDDGWEPRSNQGSPSYSDAASGGSPLADDIDLCAE